MGLRARLLEIPIVYETLQNAVVRPERKSWLPHCLIEAKPGMTVLDVGCGTGKILTDLPEVTYVGIDHNRDYVAQANYRHGLRGRFLAIDANNAAFKELGQFDRILLIGVLHHLSDEECLHLLPKLHEALAPDGLLVTYDNAIAKGQHPIARLLAKLDRGRYARSAARYRALIEETFGMTCFACPTPSWRFARGDAIPRNHKAHTSSNQGRQRSLSLAPQHATNLLGPNSPVAHPPG